MPAAAHQPHQPAPACTTPTTSTATEDPPPRRGQQLGRSLSLNLGWRRGSLPISCSSRARARPAESQGLGAEARALSKLGCGSGVVAGSPGSSGTTAGDRRAVTARHVYRLHHNCFVHIVMNSYYLLAWLGYTNFWWKRLVTRLQLDFYQKAYKCLPPGSSKQK
ncbi:Putative elongation of fatty acids protein 1 [Frankliniella fusca]|uniref:Elongation of fatty acids protein 1 n=1 Tax=Frankliniella fusca TaxID=407009 RepID=A0AAE1LTZ9_9NEOP|nr:Putative elongation of fatty acids protein 1 [Frankliniella fusca]